MELRDILKTNVVTPNYTNQQQQHQNNNNAFLKPERHYSASNCAASVG